ncbi:hypothetical protein LINPERPRIM_LOCUS26386 [Linum perenne]
MRLQNGRHDAEDGRRSRPQQVLVRGALRVQPMQLPEGKWWRSDDEGWESSLQVWIWLHLYRLCCLVCIMYMINTQRF